MQLIKPHEWVPNGVFIYYPYPPFILSNHKRRLDLNVNHMDEFNMPSIFEDLIETTL